MDSGREILEGLGWLAEAYAEPLTPERVKVYTMALSDLSPEELSMGFNRAIREQKFWPRPSELRELATGNAAIMVGKLAVDEAWEWVNQYLSLFGKLTQKRWELQGHIFHGEQFNDILERMKYDIPLATSAPFYELNLWPVPNIPELIEQTLRAMAGSEMMGMQRIKDARRGYDERREEALGGKDAAFVRKDFDEYYSHALAARRAGTGVKTTALPATTSPQKLLAGEAAPELPALTPTCMAIHLDVNQWGDILARHLRLEEAERLHDEGILPDHLYESCIRHHQRKEEQRRVMNTPRTYNGVYLGRYEPAYFRIGELTDLADLITEIRYGLCAGYAHTGCFRIEDSDGRRIVHSCFPMAHGDMKLTLGQVVKFEAKPRDLSYSENPRRFFDLALCVRDNHKEVC